MDRAHSWADGRGAPRRPAQHWDGDDAPSSGGPCNASCLLEGPCSVTHGSGGMSTPQGDRAVPCVLRRDHAVASWALGGGCGMPLSSERCVRIQTQQGAGQGAGLHFPSHPGNKPCSNPAGRVAVSLRAQGTWEAAGSGEGTRHWPGDACRRQQNPARPACPCLSLPVPTRVPSTAGPERVCPGRDPQTQDGDPQMQGEDPQTQGGDPQMQNGDPLN